MQQGNVRGQESPEASDIVGNQSKGIPDNSPLEEVNQLVLYGNEDPYNGLRMQDQRTDVAPTFAARVVQESDGDAQNVETYGLDSNTMQVKNSDEKIDYFRSPITSNYIFTSVF